MVSAIGGEIVRLLFLSFFHRLCNVLSRVGIFLLVDTNFIYLRKIFNK